MTADGGGWLQGPEKLMTADGGLITGAGEAYDSGRGADYRDGTDLWQSTGGWLQGGAGEAYDSGRGANYSGWGSLWQRTGSWLQERERLMIAAGVLITAAGEGYDSTLKPKNPKTLKP